MATELIMSGVTVFVVASSEDQPDACTRAPAVYRAVSPTVEHRRTRSLCGQSRHPVVQAIGKPGPQPGVLSGELGYHAVQMRRDAMRADLIVIDGDPLAELGSLRKVRHIFTAGRPVT
ncbi:hypothetical protein [Streptomyces sp. NBC_00448]|uniref:hypothetical protein n=1 Tax=Streptomyces sp. NBC_00448 TaxID=2903652 RepID=UPI002E240F52